MPKDLNGFFCPKSVAIIGASRSADKVGSIILRNITTSGYEGKIYPVNPNTDKINDITCYRSISSLPEIPDLAVVALPAELSVEVLSELGEKGVKNVVLYAAGFKEIGETGKALEDKLLESAKKFDLNILGPNCLGFVNNSCKLNATFGQSVNESGSIKFISQSGAIAASIFDWAKSIGLGFSEFITLGNKSVINEADILEYFLFQSKNNSSAEAFPIGMYLESITDGAEFLRLAKELSEKHPLFVIKPGKTEAAATAMRSHTGSMAGEDDVLEAALAEAGVIRCSTLEEFFDIARSLSWGKLPEGPRVAVISNAGGPGVLSADAIALEGLKLVSFDENARKKLEEVLPRTASILDPVDLMGDALAERFGHAAEIIIENSEVDYLLFILTPQLMTQIDKTAEYISYVSKKYGKPIVGAFIGGTQIAEGEKILNKNKIPVFRFPERAIKAISLMWKCTKAKSTLINKPSDQGMVTLPPDGGQIRRLIQTAVNEKLTTLGNVDADALVRAVGINTPPTQFVEDYTEAHKFAETYGWPVVLKLSAQGLLHKLDIGGVFKNITNEDGLADAFHKLENKIEQIKTVDTKLVRIQIQKGIVGGVEVIVGLKNDSTFGPVLMFGAGGSFVEIINDKNISLLPLDLVKARRLVENSKIFKILKGDGMHPAYALEKLYDLIVRVGKLTHVVPEAEEIEINPVIVTLNDVWGVDTKIVMRVNNLPPQPALKVAGPKYRVAKTLSHVTLASKFNYYDFEAEQPLEFEAGQYISVKVADTAVRAYSIATRTDSKHFALLVDTRPGGPGSMYFENIKPGDKMLFLGPFGKFVYNQDDGAEDLLFLATGSGASAVRCMIDRALTELNTTKKMKLYFGLTFEEEIFWKDHFDELSQKYPNFSYEIALFKPTENWKGARGFITELIKNDYPDASKCSAYLCGHRSMIADASDILAKNGCPQERIYTERFV